MTISSTTNRVSYTGNGVTTAFAFSYPFQAQSDLKVLLVLISTGAETLQTITTHYTISGTTTNGVYASGGTINMVTAPSALYKLVIYRDPALTQTIDLVENDALPAETLEQGLDKAMLVNQRTRELTERAITLPDGFTGTFDTMLPSDINTPDILLKVNSAGDGFEAGPTAVDIADAEENAIAAAASASAASASAAAASASAASAASGVFTTALTIPEISTPSTPSSGSIRAYAKSNNVIHTLNDGGLERQLVSTLESDLLENITFSVSMASNAMTVAVKDSAGNNLSSTTPGFVNFGNATLTNPLYVMRTLTAALSIVGPSGATFGCRDGIDSVYYVFLIDDAGTIDVGLCRLRLTEDKLYTTVAVDTNSDVSYVLYSNSVHTNCRIRCIGQFNVTQATAGTHATAANNIFCAKRSMLPVQEVIALMAKTSSSNPGTTAATKVPWESVASSEQAFDPLSLCNLTNERILSGIAGKQLLIVDLSLANFEASATLQVYIYKNGSAFRRLDVLSNGVGTTRNFSFNLPIEAGAATDYWEIFTSSGADSSYSIVGNTGVDSKSFFGLCYFL